MTFNNERYVLMNNEECTIKIDPKTTNLKTTLLEYETANVSVKTKNKPFQTEDNLIGMGARVFFCFVLAIMTAASITFFSRNILKNKSHIIVSNKTEEKEKKKEKATETIEKTEPNKSKTNKAPSKRRRRIVAVAPYDYSK